MPSLTKNVNTAAFSSLNRFFAVSLLPICEWGPAGRHFATAKIRKMWQTLLLSVLIIAIAMALLAVRVIIKRGGKFSSFHIHDSKAMKDRGIHCVIDQDREARNRKGGVSERTDNATV